jgi:hypothetical protein
VIATAVVVVNLRCATEVARNDDQCSRQSSTIVEIGEEAAARGIKLRQRPLEFLGITAGLSQVALASGAHETVTTRVPASISRRASSTLWHRYCVHMHRGHGLARQSNETPAVSHPT